MLTTWEGKRIKAHGFKTINAVKAQFRKAGCIPGFVSELQFVQADTFGEQWQWLCQCGAKLRFTKNGKRFNDLCILKPPIGG